MKHITKGVVGGTVSMIKVQHPINCDYIYPEVISSLQIQPPWDPIINEDEVMHRLLQQNQLHLSQTYETPFASGPLKDHIGEFGTSNGAQQILDSNFDTTNFENLPAVNYWIKYHI
eukprot:11966290-Ditylum_brightwellii.AAC.1